MRSYKNLYLTPVLFCLLLFSCRETTGESSGENIKQVSNEKDVQLEELTVNQYNNNGVKKNSPAYAYSSTMTEVTLSDNATGYAFSNTSLAASPENDKVYTENKIIKTADLNVEVKEIKKATEEINKIINHYKGYIGQLTENNKNYILNTTMTIRVPHAGFDSLVANILNVGIYVHRKEVKANDVTEEYIDVASRLKTKREVEKRYLQILKQAKSVNDILNVERQLSYIREEIEAKEGRLKYLNDQVSYSSVQLEIFQQKEFEAIPVVEAGFFSKTATAFTSGWKNLLNFIVGIFQIWPFMIVLAIAALILRRVLKAKALKDKAL